MNNYTWLIDAGHGGVSIDGSYLTKGKQSPQVPPGIYEGEFNRKVAAELIRINDGEFDIEVINPAAINIKESAKVAYANELHAKTKNCVYIAIHANAKGKGEAWYDAHGFGVFHYPTSKKGLKLAKKLFSKMTQNTDLSTRYVMPKKFYVLSKTKMPAILLESGFMTNKHDAAYLASYKGVNDIATAILEMIAGAERSGI
jgi:N-acetylmuramoyl-L-alanine amidase